MRPGLLVSVRSVEEAKAALAGGADLIDVKEPSRGALGSADLEVAESIVSEVACRTPVSVALGEWSEWTPRRLPRGVKYAKWGLSRSGVTDSAAIVRCEHALPVLVGYADSDRADSPSIDELVEAACELRFPAFLIDTAIKDGAGLLEWTSIVELERIRHKLGMAGVRLALAGSLDVESIRRLARIAPNWFAVRGAACVGGRHGTVCANRVKQLKAILDSPRTTSVAR